MQKRWCRIIQAQCPIGGSSIKSEERRHLRCRSVIRPIQVVQKQSLRTLLKRSGCFEGGFYLGPIDLSHRVQVRFEESLPERAVEVVNVIHAMVRADDATTRCIKRSSGCTHAKGAAQAWLARAELLVKIMTQSKPFLKMLSLSAATMLNKFALGRSTAQLLVPSSDAMRQYLDSPATLPMRAVCVTPRMS